MIAVTCGESKADDRMLLREPHRRAGVIDEFSFVFDQNPRRLTTLGTGHPCHESLYIVVPELSDAVVAFRRPAPPL